MLQPTIRPARSDEHDVVAQVWMESWVSTGLEDASNFLLAKLRARIPMEIEKGWSLFVADDGGAIAAMLALHLRERYLDQLFVAPNYQGKGIGRQLLAWYEREGFAFEKEQVEPSTGFAMKYYRWKKSCDKVRKDRKA